MVGLRVEYLKHISRGHLMVGRNRTTMSGKEDKPPLASLKSDSHLLATGDAEKTKQGKIGEFVESLREAHRYVNNRRSAINHN
jgi:hypothetical protein